MSKAVRIVDVPDDDDEAEMMGGTACVVEYHRRCAPQMCERCGSELQLPANYCGRCGIGLTDEAKQAKKARRNL